MNYYIIPKNNIKIQFNLQLSKDPLEPSLSQSLFFHLNEIPEQLSSASTQDDSLEYINQIVNPFEFIHSNVPGSSISVSKVKADSTMFFELMELFQIFNINDVFSTKSQINVAHLTHNCSSSNYLMDMIREDNKDITYSSVFDYKTIVDSFVKQKHTNKFDLMICEFKEEEYREPKQYMKNLLLVLFLLTTYQQSNGICVLKIDNMFYKPVLDMVLILSSIYDKVCLGKPSISNVTKGERYLICKGFREGDTTRKLSLNIGSNLERINLERINDMYISSFINNPLPYYLLNKLEESNLIIGQQQLDAHNQTMNLIKNKNRDEKMENMKRSHIQKCIQWCEKNQLPHNKFIDKVNIFLIPKKKEESL